MRYRVIVCLLFLTISANATTFSKEKKSNAKGIRNMNRPYCEVGAKFLTEVHALEKIGARTETIVGWKFQLLSARSILSAPCPVTDFVLTVRGVTYYVDPDTGSGAYAYSVGIPRPPKKPVVADLVQKDIQYGAGGKSHREWRVEDPWLDIREQ